MRGGANGAGVAGVRCKGEVAGGVGTVNWIWNANRIGQTTEALAVADGLAAVALSVLCVVLCFYAWPYLVPEPDSEREADLLP